MPIKDSELFKPFYKELLEKTAAHRNLCTFFPQSGRYYTTAPIKILFIGKAVNGWCPGSDSTELDFLFSPEGIVNRPDEMSWINKPWISTQSTNYSANKSAFWRIIKKLTILILNREDWWNWIAWSNLYKRTPSKGGNPNLQIRKSQLNICKNILDQEIALLKPNIIVFLTSGWEIDFNLGIEKEGPRWEKYSTYFNLHNSQLYIRTAHPQGKKETPHLKVLLSIINQQYKNPIF